MAAQTAAALVPRIAEIVREALKHAKADPTLEEWIEYERAVYTALCELMDAHGPQLSLAVSQRYGLATSPAHVSDIVFYEFLHQAVNNLDAARPHSLAYMKRHSFAAWRQVFQLTVGTDRQKHGEAVHVLSELATLFPSVRLMDLDTDVMIPSDDPHEHVRVPLRIWLAVLDYPTVRKVLDLTLDESGLYDRLVAARKELLAHARVKYAAELDLARFQQANVAQFLARRPDLNSVFQWKLAEFVHPQLQGAIMPRIASDPVQRAKIALTELALRLSGHGNIGRQETMERMSQISSSLRLIRRSSATQGAELLDSLLLVLPQMTATLAACTLEGIASRLV